MTSGLSARDVVAGYLAAPVLHGLSIDLRPGTAVGLLGPNGAGKTSLLRVLAGQLRTRSGAVRWDGTDISRRPAWWRSRHGIAHVPEGRRLFGALTVAENLTIGTFARGGPPDLTVAYDLFPKLHERRDQQARTLSGGEQQMVAIGRALVSRPKAVMVDELSAGLAPVVAQHLVNRLTLVKETGVALLLVEQAPALILDDVDHIVVLGRGTVVHAGPTADLDRSHLRHLYLGQSAHHPTAQAMTHPSDGKASRP